MRKAFLTLHGVRTLVTETGERKALICLHGWGASHASFQELREALRDDPVRVIAPDLPGCGESGDPPSPWGVDDYVLWLEALMTALHVERCSLLGHSHGGRIAIAYSAKQPLCLQHLYLCAAAGIGRDASRRSLLSMTMQRKFWPNMAKLGNTFLSIPGLRSHQPLCRKYLYKFLGVHDYERGSAIMKRTMTGVIDRDLTPFLSSIIVSTDIFWGAEDSTTPLTNGTLLNKKIVQSRLHVFPGVRHRVHRGRAGEIAEVIRTNL